MGKTNKAAYATVVALVSLFMAVFVGVGSLIAYFADVSEKVNRFSLGEMSVVYTVTFVNDDGEVISQRDYERGDTITVPSDPVTYKVNASTLEDSSHFTYTFERWDGDVVDDILYGTGAVTCTGDAVYTATYSKDTVSWFVKGDSSTLEVTGQAENDAYAKALYNSSSYSSGQLVLYPTNAGLQEAKGLDLVGTMENQATIESAPWYGQKDAATSIYVAGGCRTNENAQGAFYSFASALDIDCTNLDTSLAENTSYFFSDCVSAESIYVDFDVRNVLDMSYMFEDCQSVEALDVTSFMSGGSTTGNCTNFRSIFDNCYVVTEIEGAEDFDVSNGTDLALFFSECQQITTLDLSGWDTGNAEDLMGTFSGMQSLQFNDTIANLDTSSALDMSRMFQYCYSFVNVYFNYDTSSCENMTRIFMYCINLEELDISSFNTRNVDTFTTPFDRCEQLRVVHVGPDFGLKGSGSAGGVFRYPEATYIEGVDGYWYADSTGKAYAYNAIPNYVSGGETYRVFPPVYAAIYSPDQDTSTANEYLVFGRSSSGSAPSTYNGLNRYKTYWGYTAGGRFETDTYSSAASVPWYSYRSCVKYVVFLDDYEIKPANMGYWFYGFNYATSYNFSGLNTSVCTGFNHLFYGNNSLTSVNVALFDTSRGKSFAGMFYNCVGISKLTLTNMDTLSSTNMNNMFYGMSNLTTVVTGSNFSFKGSGTLTSGSAAVLPGSYWKSAAGTTYAVAKIPNCVATTYTKVS